MKLITQVKLQPTSEQKQYLLTTLQITNMACNDISEQAWIARVFHQYALHHLCYYITRARFNLTAQMVIRCIAKVADAYKLDKKVKRTFKITGGITFDDQILHWYPDKSLVSIWTISGRQKIPFVCGEYQRKMLATRQGESDLVLINGTFYLFATCDIENPESFIPTGILGIDMGVINIAVDSDGRIYSANKINNIRYRHRRLRAKLQSKDTKSAKRLLRKLSGKESRFARYTNHCLSKYLVARAKDTKRAIAIENLKGINTRTTVRHSQRAIRMSWSFWQLRQYITYKAKCVGVPVFTIDPKNTSRTCPSCGCIDKRNRPNQSTFSCVACGFSGLADHIAACVIAGLAAVTQPYAGSSNTDLQNLLT